MELAQDVIAAIATAPGESGLAVVRVSGPGAVGVADAVFRGRGSLAAAASHTLHHGWAVWPRGDRPGAASTPGATSAPGAAFPSGDLDAPDSASLPPPAMAPRAAAAPGSTSAPGTASTPGAAFPHGAAEGRLDEVVAAVFRAPASFTRQDVVELSCHGGRLSAARVLDALLAAGARLARPGEFTLRAFLHGRIDLAQAEAVVDLIHAETRAAHELALSQLGGSLSRTLDALHERLSDALAEVEARVDFAEDVGGVEVPEHVVAAVGACDAELAGLLAGAAWARAVREGVRVLLAGRPNVGKSSLFNALLGEDRAIVTPEPGTTRDLVAERLELAGAPVTLIDAAGLRESGDGVEQLGVSRAREALATCAVALWVVDRSRPLGAEDRAIAAHLAGRRVVVALNKCDLAAAVTPACVTAALEADARVVEVSALRGEGLDQLRAALAAALGAGAGRAGAVSNPRHAEALERARAALSRARGCAAREMAGEIVALELREGLSALDEVTGRGVGEDLLERIFSRFCIGK